MKKEIENYPFYAFGNTQSIIISTLMTKRNLEDFFQ